MPVFQISRLVGPTRALTPLAAAALLTLGSCERTTVTAAANPPPSHYFVDGKLSTKEAVDKLSPESISRVDVLSGQQAKDYTHDPNASGVVLVQTK